MNCERVVFIVCQLHRIKYKPRVSEMSSSAYYYIVVYGDTNMVLGRRGPAQLV